MDDLGDTYADFYPLCNEHHHSQYSTASATGSFGGHTGPNSLDRDVQYCWNSHCYTYDRLVNPSVWSKEANALHNFWLRYFFNTLRSSNDTRRISHLQSFSGRVWRPISSFIASYNSWGIPKATAQFFYCCLGNGGCLWSHNWTDCWRIYI